MRIYLLITLFCLFVAGSCQTISNVRLPDHTTYIIQLIQKAVDRIQKYNWQALQVHDVTLEIDEEILDTTANGTLTFTNGFIVSMQHIDLVQSTVQQVWLYNRTSEVTSLELRSTMRMLDVAIGFDVDADFSDGKFRRTGVIVYPLIHLQCTLTKNLHTDELSSTVIPVLIRTTNRMQLVPDDNLSQVVGSMFDFNSISPSLDSWADVFASVILNVAETDHRIPAFCYNCPV